MKKLLAILVCLAMLASVAACGADPEPPSAGSSRPDSGNAQSAEADTVATVTTLALESLPLPEGMIYATAQCAWGDRVWVGGIGESDALLGFAGERGEGLPLPEEAQFVYAMCAAPEGMAVLCGSLPEYYINAVGVPEHNSGTKGELSILLFDESGVLTETVPLEKNYTDAGMIFMLCAVEDGFVMQAQSELIKISPDGTEAGVLAPKLDTDELISSICVLQGTLVAAVGPFFEDGSRLCLIDPEGEMSAVGELELGDENVTGLGAAGDGRLILCTEQGLSYMDMESGELESVLTWEDMYADSGYISAGERGDGHLLFARYEEKVNYTAYKQSAERERLLVVTDEARGSMQALAMEFNRSQEKYHVDVESYDFYNDPGAGDALRTRVSAGDGPDIYAFRLSDTLSDTKSENMCLDLLPYLDSDPEYGRETILPGLLDAMTEDGALYWLPYQFWVITMTARESIIPEPGITLDEARSALESLGDDWTLLPLWVTSDIVLAWVSGFAAEKYVDREANACYFDSPGFVELLEMCGEYSHEGSAIGGEDTSVLNYEPLQSMARMCALAAADYWHGDYCFVGFPTPDGSGSYFELQGRLAISPDCDNTEGAWEFLRFSMSAEGQQLSGSYGFAASLPALEKQVEDAIAEGDPNFGKITQRDADKLWQLLDNTTLLEGANGAVRRIMMEEAAPYFAGDRSAEEAARQIQSRVSIYLAERS